MSKIQSLYHNRNTWTFCSRHWSMMVFPFHGLISIHSRLTRSLMQCNNMQILNFPSMKPTLEEALGKITERSLFFIIIKCLHIWCGYIYSKFAFCETYSRRNCWEDQIETLIFIIIKCPSIQYGYISQGVICRFHLPQMRHWMLWGVPKIQSSLKTLRSRLQMLQILGYRHPPWWLFWERYVTVQCLTLFS